MAQATAGLETFQKLLLEMASDRDLGALLERIVRGLADRPEVALARLWLIQPGDICDACAMRAECPQRVPCLHLVASAGRSTVDPDLEWSGLDGSFRRFPIGGRKVGHIAASGEPVMVPEIAEDSRWIRRPEWAAAEGIRGFGGQPLEHGRKVLGVLAVFTRAPFVSGSLAWLRLIAHHASAAIANARAFAEIERLRAQLEVENAYLREEVAEAGAFGELLGDSEALGTIAHQIELVAPTDANVLILGETGTGKELVAREIHRRSARATRPLIKVNCASIPHELYESEFFGHVRGSFTGAVRDREGRFAAADRGTLLLDEVGEIPLPLQSKLLRVLQEGEYERVGDERTRTVDVRVLAATNRDLKAEITAGRFREDLYYRLNVFPIEVAPLRERPGDIEILARHFLAAASRRLQRPAPRLDADGLRRLQAYDWPGNVRELQNVIERAVITAEAGRLEFDLAPGRAGVASRSRAPGAEAAEGDDVVPQTEIDRRDRANLLAALRKTQWRVAGADGAAELLGVKPTTLRSRMQKLGLSRLPRGSES